MDVRPTRRDILLGATALSMAGAGSRDAQAKTVEIVKGQVVEIIGGPTATPRRIPLADIRVSNGREITRTDAEGCYRLSVAPQQSIFVIKPLGFQVPLDPATRLPRFSYVHDPDGTPADLNYAYGGMPPTGPLPASIDFELIRTPEPKAFDVILFTDPQPESAAEIEFVRDDVVCNLVGTKAAFGVTCGDIAFGDLSMYGRINQIIGRIGLPWWNIGGNHDFDDGAPSAARARDTYKRVFGATYYAFEYGHALFVMLDNVDYIAPDPLKPDDHGSYRGHVSDDQLGFVQNLLDTTPRDKLVVLVMHIPLRTYLDPSEPAQNTVNARDLLKLLGDRPCVSFSGHTHSTEHHYLGADDGFDGATPHHHHVLTAVSGSWWSGPLDHRGIASADSYDGTPNGYHVLSIDGSTYTTRFIAAGEPGGGRPMRISLETEVCRKNGDHGRDRSMVELLRSPIRRDQCEGTRLVVNVFDGGPKTRVRFEIDGAEAFAMTRTSRPDPFIQQVYARHAETIKGWVKPQNSSHIWQAALPGGLPSGAYSIRVFAVDEYDREHSDGMVLEIA